MADGPTPASAAGTGVPDFLSRNRFLPEKGETTEEKLYTHLRAMKEAMEAGQFSEAWEAKYGSAAKVKKDHNSTMSKVLGIKNVVCMLVLMMSLGSFHFTRTVHFTVTWLSGRVDVHMGVSVVPARPSAY